MLWGTLELVFHGIDEKICARLHCALPFYTIAWKVGFVYTLGLCNIGIWAVFCFTTDVHIFTRILGNLYHVVICFVTCQLPNLAYCIIRYSIGYIVSSSRTIGIIFTPSAYGVLSSSICLGHKWSVCGHNKWSYWATGMKPLLYKHLVETLDKFSTHAVTFTYF